jgi:hypothetical protein
LGGNVYKQNAAFERSLVKASLSTRVANICAKTKIAEIALECLYAYFEHSICVLAESETARISDSNPVRVANTFASPEGQSFQSGHLIWSPGAAWRSNGTQIQEHRFRDNWPAYP